VNSEPRLLHEFFERQVRLRPDAPAVEFRDETLSYAQLDALAERVAALLRARGVVTGSLVGLYLEKSAQLFAAMLGILKAGAGYVPLDPKFPLARVVSILDDSNATVVITERDLAVDLGRQTAAEVIFLSEDLKLHLPSPPSAPAAIVPNDVCYVIYTSGSTGRPKGVLIEHRNAVNFVRALESVYRLNANDRVYQGFSVAFDASVEEIWGALSLGGTLVVPTGEVARSALDAAEFIKARKLTFFSTVPSFLAMIGEELPSVRLLVLGGESCSAELVQRWATPHRRMMNTYGPTEATVVATATDCVPGAPVTIGKALPGYTAHVLDEHMQVVKPGATGELYIGGASVARGYLNRDELTKERFIPDPFDPSPGARLYRTMDIVEQGATGGLHFIGRGDAQIKIRGFRIELAEIEAVLMAQPSIQAAAVNAVEFGNLKELAAYVVLAKGVTAFDREKIADELRKRLPEYMVPRYLDVVAMLPLMTSGKVDRKQLPAPQTVLGRLGKHSAAPTTATERAVIEVWQNVFKVSPISIDDDFFLDLRGHSLFAAEAVTALRAKLGTLRVSIPDLYEFRTARAFAKHLDAVGAAKPPPGADEKPAGETSAAHAPLPWFCAACVLLQFITLIAFYTVATAPVTFAVVIALEVRDGEMTLFNALNLGTTIAFLVWPSWLFLSIAVKWLVIGRFKPGRYPVWGFYYFRWWLVTRFQGLSWSEMFVGTPLMSLYYRAMGAKVGRHCTIDTPYCAAFDLVSIGEDTSIGGETHMLGYRVEDGWLILGNIDIGSECYVGTHCCVGLGTTMRNRSRLDDMTHLSDSMVLEADQGMRGSPAFCTEVDLGELHASAGPARYRRGRTVLYGLIHLGLIYAMGYFLILGTLPSLAAVSYAFVTSGPLLAGVVAIASIPLSLLWYFLLLVLVKRLFIGRIAPGIHPQQSRAYLRYWFFAYLMTNTRHIALPLYATMYLPVLLRLLGAKIGYGAEVSTALRLVPDLLEIGNGGFLADACIVGGHRSYLGLVELRANKIGERSFIGNSALVPAGIDIGSDCLIGVMSTPPQGTQRVSDHTRWLGSPGFELPHTQEVSAFGTAHTFLPATSLVNQRALVEVFKIVLPDMLAVADLVMFCNIVGLAYYLLPLDEVIVVGALAAFILSFASVAVVAAIKRFLMGTFAPVVMPFWSRYVWFNDVINGLFETVAAAAMTPMLGTLFAAPALRMMGCKVGRWVFLETTLFSEFDLVEIGHYASLNLGATIQTHLFEDRVMKSDRLKIGNECSVGNMSVVLYSTEMKRGARLAPLSVLMKGETLPAFTHWTGIPTRPVEFTPQQTPTTPPAKPPTPPRKRDDAPSPEQSAIRARVDRVLSAR
jgi:non-ribosomal peptide synthetase-like protein